MYILPCQTFDIIYLVCIIVMCHGVQEIKMKPEYGTCNISEMTASELILELRTAEFATNRTIELKDNAFDYDVEGFAESIQDDDRLFDFDFDGSRIVCNGQTFCTFRLVSE